MANRVIPQGTGKRAAFVTHQRPALGTIQAELVLMPLDEGVFAACHTRTVAARPRRDAGSLGRDVSVHARQLMLRRTPPVIGAGAPVVSGKVIGSFRAERTAR